MSDIDSSSGLDRDDTLDDQASGSEGDDSAQAALVIPRGQEPKDMSAVSRAVLKECVKTITGRDDVPPRIGQARLLDDLSEAYTTTYLSSGETGGQVLAEAPTGVGKSLAYLAPAFAAMAVMGQRTVISTEMISLQTQIIDKDAPVVAAACEKVTGYRPSVALLKGWGNYACTSATVDAAEAIVGEVHESGHTKIVDLRDKVAAHLATISPKRKADGTLDFSAMLNGLGTVTSSTLEERERVGLVAWALDEAASLGEKRTDGTGDKNTYPGNMSDSMAWDSVSVSSGDCIGAAKCAFSDQCLPGKAREKAANADVVVTNHHLLAVQAAKAVPVVIGSKNLGKFDHIVIDEAHGLPSIVRNQGSVEVSGRSIKRAAKSIGRVLDDTDPKVAKIIKDGEAIADRVEMELDEWTARIKRGEDVLRLTQGDDPVNDTALLITNWTKNAHMMLKTVAKVTANVGTHMKIQRTRNGLDALDEAVGLVAEHQPGTARWVETVRPHFKAADQNPYPSAKYTPVNVSALLRFNLWTVEDTEAIEAQAEAHEGDGPPPRKSLTVAALSATLPKGFAVQMGLKAPLKKYESPFDDAYGASVLFVPRANDADDVEALRRPFPGKAKFDTAKHTAWATTHVLDLVEANGGSALILAATATAGRVYAEALKTAARGRWNVLSQWDGAALRKQVADWKEDTNAVLIGTKSLMTGVDASGETCTLVIVDRPARARSNPVDDARVEMLMEAAQMDKWAADRLVYVADAGMLLEQAAGRLIRTTSDSGMVAVLDPRLLKTSPFAYNHATRNDYLETLHRFERKIADPAKAHQWLREHRASLAEKVSA